MTGSWTSCGSTGTWLLAPGQTTVDNRLSLVEVRCVGACALAPVFLTDDHLIGKKTSPRQPHCYARLIAILGAVERIEQLLDDPHILDQRVRAMAGVNGLEGVGVIEAPRGTLIHHYRVNDDGLIEEANLIITTGHNNLAMQRGILQAAQHFLNGATLQEGLLNRIEAVIRSFDPCLSCSTHAVGCMPLVVELLAANGTLLDR